MAIEKDLNRIANALEALLLVATHAGEELDITDAGKPTPAAPAEASSEQTTSGAEAAGPNASEENGVTKDELRASLTAFQKKHGRDPTKALIEPYGATIGKIKSTDYEKVIAAIEDFSGAA